MRAFARLKVRLPRTDGKPRRAYTSVNVRFEEKALFDHLHSWWSLRGPKPVAQVDAFSRVLALALEHPDADVPSDLVVKARQKGG